VNVEYEVVVIVDVVVGVGSVVVVYGSGVDTGVPDTVLHEEPYNVAKAVTGTLTVSVSVTIWVETLPNDDT
jgi:hypothetical protein